MKPPVPYYGGKQMLASRIIALFPPHQHYVEPYAGSLSILLAKPPVMLETVNDLDGDLMTFWRVLRDRGAELERACVLTPYGRAELQAAYEDDGRDELEVARRVWVRLTQGRGHRLTSQGWKFAISPAIGISMPDYLDGFIGRLHPAARRLRRVALECRPALCVVADYGRDPEVLLYVDPPYVHGSRSTGGSRGSYTNEMTDDDHRELAAALHACRACVVLSGYPSPLYDELYPDWHRVELDTRSTQGGRGAARTEVLWSNRPPSVDATLFDGDLGVGHWQNKHREGG